MTEKPPRLERRYRRLLRAYPAWYRRHRRTEMLTTLMDAAPPERRRPTAGDTVDLLAGGLRVRMSAANIPVLLAAVAMAILLGVVGAAGGAAAGWAFAEDLPDDKAAAAIATTVSPHADGIPELRQPNQWGFEERETGPPSPVFGGRGDVVGGYLDFLVPTGSYVPGYVLFDFGYSGAEDVFLATAKERLEADGWQAEPTEDGGLGKGFDAQKDGLLIRVISTGGYQPEFTGVQIGAAPPTAAPLLTAFGFIAGMLLGWLIACRLGREVAGQRSWRKVAGGLSFVIAAVAFAVPAATGLVLTGAALVDPADPVAVWLPFISTGWLPEAWIGALALLCSLGLALAPGERDHDRAPQARRAPRTN